MLAEIVFCFLPSSLAQSGSCGSTKHRAKYCSQARASAAEAAENQREKPPNKGATERKPQSVQELTSNFELTPNA